MAADPRRLRPRALCKLVNSTPLGAVLSEPVLARHRVAAGVQIDAAGDPQCVDLLRYAAWLAWRRHQRYAPPPAPVAAMAAGDQAAVDLAAAATTTAAATAAATETAAERYERMKRDAAARNAEASAAGRDIGHIPPVADPARKASCAQDLCAFCRVYLPRTFSLPFSADHLAVLRRLQEAAIEGGRYALAMPRGSGKTALCEATALWAALYGRRQYTLFIGADESAAAERLASLAIELDTNDLLLADFPEVCFPLRELEGIANRCAGQTYQGERTHIEFTARRIVLPTIPGSAAAGAIVEVAGILGRLRGKNFKRPDGQAVRPQFVIADDPQTDTSALSPLQCAQRERIISAGIMGLAGPRVEIAVVMPCTVIRPGDLADNMLSRDLHPEWQGERYKTVYDWPARQDLWDRYAELRREQQRLGRDNSAATEFYAAHRPEMDRGARVAWPERYKESELSALQSAYNFRIDDEASFQSEGQNEPLPAEAGEEPTATAAEIAERCNRHARGAPPLGTERITAFCDVQKKAIYWLVAGWSDDFTGAVLDYGVFPDQRTSYFSLSQIRRSLQTLFPKAGLEGQIFAGLGAVADLLLDRTWRRDDGAEMRIERLLIDQGWESDTIHRFCRQTRHAALVMPAKGLSVRAANVPLNELKRGPGERVGFNWRIPSVRGKRVLRYVLTDVNFWKSFVHARLAQAVGDRGALTLFGDSPAVHKLLADHLTAESRVTTKGRGRTVEEWALKPGGPDNHWFDCLVGAAVAASMGGATLGEAPGPPIRRRRLSLSALREKKLGRPTS